MDTVTSRSRSNSGLNFLSLLEKSYRTPPGSDYLVTTKKLRDRVTSVKSPQRRSTKLISKSAPPFQNRNLDNYPMPHNRDDVLSSAKGRRSEKQVREKKNASTRVYSGNMREYSKQMFDFAVMSAKNNSKHTSINHKKLQVNNKLRNDNCVSVNTTKWADARRQSVTEQDPRTNGPTPDGSILYNRRQKVLNSIRIRPKSECDGQYTHDRSTSRLSLHENILEKNQHYRVLNLNDVFHPGTVSGRTTSCSTDVLLVPVDQSTERDFYRERIFTDSVIDYPDDTFSELAKNESRASTCDPFDERDIADGRKSRERSRLLPPSSSCNVKLVSLEEQSSSESEEEQEEQAPPPPPPEPKKQEPLKSPVKKNAKLSIPEPEPEVKPVKVKVVLKGPKCWVDDATITSDESDNEPEDEVIEPEPPTPQIKSVLKGVLNMKQNIGVMSKLMNSKQPPAGHTKDLGKSNKGQAIKDVVKVEPNPPLPPEPVNPEPVKPELAKEEMEKEPEKEEEKPVYLPPFLCPSSERKSREAAIKDCFEHVRAQLLNQFNITDIEFLIINSHEQHAVDNVGEISRRVTFPIYQDTFRSRIWNQLGGGKDDTFIYDRCGKLTHHIPFPRSLLRYRDFQMALWQTYYRNPCNCDPTAIQQPSRQINTRRNQARTVVNVRNRAEHHNQGHEGHHHGHAHHHGSHSGSHHSGSHHSGHHGSRHHRSTRRRFRRHLRFGFGDSSRTDTISERNANPVSKRLRPKIRPVWHNMFLQHKGFLPRFNERLHYFVV